MNTVRHKCKHGKEYLSWREDGVIIYGHYKCDICRRRAAQLREVDYIIYGRRRQYLKKNMS